MKRLTLLFSLYFLTLSCIPCADSAECASEDNEVVATALHKDHSEEVAQNCAGEENHSDHSCTPLCSCACCAIAICCASEQVSAEHPQQLPSPVKHSGYTDKSLSGISSSIWQPPKQI